MGWGGDWFGEAVPLNLGLVCSDQYLRGWVKVVDDDPRDLELRVLEKHHSSHLEVLDHLVGNDRFAQEILNDHGGVLYDDLDLYNRIMSI